MDYKEVIEKLYKQENKKLLIIIIVFLIIEKEERMGWVLKYLKK